MELERTRYEVYVQERNIFAYYRGLLSRFFSHLKYEYYAYKARSKGACIGHGVVMCKDFMRACNKNVTVGNHCVINTGRIIGIGHYPLKIGDNVIIGDGVKIVLGGHDLDSEEWQPFRESSKLVIEDYVWLCPDSVVLQSVKKVGRGSVLGANSVLYRSLKPMSIAVGNPATTVGTRSVVHSKLVVESLLHGDYKQYKETYKKRRKE